MVLVLAAGLSGCTSPTTSPTTTPANQQITIIDSTGKVITLPRAAERIIVTNSDCAEVLIALGAKDKIVGITNTVANTPLMAANLGNVTSVGVWDNPSIEDIIALKPDVVISYASWKPKNLKQFQAANITLVALDCYKMDNLTSDIRTMGVLVGEEKNASAYAGFIENYMNIVKDRTANLTESEKPTVYWEQNRTKITSAGMGSGGDTLIRMAGGNNIAGNETQQYPEVSAEWIVRSNPQVIVRNVGYVKSEDYMKGVIAMVENRTGMSQVRAVKDGRVYVMSTTVAFGPKGFMGLLYMAKILHPDRFADVDPQKALDAYAEKFVPGANKDIYIYPIP
ncbi:ABC transporter substrate-binding protein [Methanocella conradii]|uniref:ABC transporter substrate-binding protein n=1 Tax=Methanocella conradii TaxID=1175444 RepID=UPI0024B331CD|nr:ABC transporter substrate-binding protein [Methanocella conradii]MDI6897625.1 ABC transporter substrate-binding protein [Methanocella conradii]